MIKPNLKYALLAIILLITELLIALYMHDDFIRPTFGDFLVVILMYCGIRSFIQASYQKTIIVVLLISYIIEVSQYFHLIKHLGLQHSTAAKLLLGSGFAWGDMLAYTLGATAVWIVESRAQQRFRPQIRNIN